MYKIYCDGSCRNNGYENAHGAYAFVLLDEDEDIKCLEAAIDPIIDTNNKAEMMAMIKALEYWELHYNDEDIEVHSDSAYIVNAYKQGWIENWKRNGWKTAKKEPVKNQDLWLRLDRFFQKEEVTLIKAKGHADDYWNNKVDELAQKRSLANG